MIADFFFGTQNDIFNNPKRTDIKFLIPQKFEVTINCLKKIRGDLRPSEEIIYRNDPLGTPVLLYIEALISKIYCTLSANRKRDSEFNV